MADVNSAAIKVVGGIESCKSDDRKYRSLVLPNGIKVLLTSDATTDMAGAALEVSVGHFSDPDHVPGLAHFLEHMLFLGTEKYPDENEYSAYLNEHGGYSNAYTASEQTQYQFEVSKAALQGALDRFAQFFIAPLFTASATDRELQAVDSEHSKNLQSDMWRAYQLDKQTSSAHHPYVKFGTGNSVTLRDEPAKAGHDVRAELLKFHKQHYSAGRMTLAILGAEDLDTLEKWAVDMFSAVPNNGSSAPVFKGHPYDGAKGILQYVKPIKDKRALSLAWAFPPSKPDWRAKSSKYLSHLLGHEGPGSLFSALRERGWATGLYGGEADGENGFAVFSVSVELSPAGLEAWECVHDLVYAYIGMLKAVGPQQWVHVENTSLAASAFQFASKGGVFNTVSVLAKNLADFPVEKAISGPALYWDWDPAGVQALIERLTPDNCRVVLTGKDELVASKCTLKEKWYGVEYGQEELGAARIARLRAAMDAYEGISKARIAANGGKPPVGGPAGLQAGVDVDKAVLAVQARMRAGKAEPADMGTWTGEGVAAALSSLYPPFTLPAPNTFIATDFGLRHPEARETAARRDAGLAPPEGEGALPGSKMMHGVRVRREDAPTLLAADATSELWLLQDAVFAVPKVQVLSLLQMPAASVSPRTAALLDLAVALAKESLTEVAYAASLAGVDYHIQCSVYGAYVHVKGFSHKLANLAAVVSQALPKMGQPAGFDQVQFNVQLDKLVRGYANYSKDAPYHHTAHHTSVALTTPRWSLEEKEKAVVTTPITAEELRTFVRSALSTARLQVLVSGNATPEEAVVIRDALAAPLKAGPTPASPPAPSTLPIMRMVALPQPILLQTGEAVTALAPEIVYTRQASNPAEPNAAIELFCQVGPRSFGAGAEQSALVELVGHIISEPFFDSLRTRQSIGYIVFGGPKYEAECTGLRFIVQSNRIPHAEELLERCNDFLASFADALASMPADVFAGHVKATAVRCSESDKNYVETAHRVWGELVDGTLDFTRASSEVAALFALTQERVVEWYRQWIAPGGSKRRVFAMLVERGAEAGPVEAAPPAAPTSPTGEAAKDVVPASAAQPASETLAGGAGQPGAEVKSPTPAGPKAPSIRMPVQSMAGVLHVLHTHQHAQYTPGAPIKDRAFVVRAFEEMAGKEVAQQLEQALGNGSGAPPKHVRLMADVDAAQHHAVRNCFPLFHSAGSIARMVKIKSTA